MKSVWENINVSTLNKNNQRIHGIDALRAIAMLLGIVLHTTIAYKVIAVPTWPHDQKFNSWGFDYLYLFIHSFRMPLFFLIAGYFCRFLYKRNGARNFISHRTKRIFIPFVCSLIFILPITIFPFLVNHYINIYPNHWKLIFSKSLQQCFHWNGMAHLWFLYYLLIYYISVLAIQWLKKIFGVKMSKYLFKNSIVLSLSIVVFLIWLLLLTGKDIYLHVDTGLLPRPNFLLFYGLFFTMGWLINLRPFFFQWMVKRVWLSLGLGVLLYAGIFYFGVFHTLRENWHILLLKLFAAAQILFLVCGTIGFFLRCFQTENRLWKYISDASYWMYLVHLSIVAGLQILFSFTTVPYLMRFWFILIITFGITLITYQTLVRYTIIGRYLHGPREKPKESLIQNIILKT